MSQRWWAATCMAALTLILCDGAMAQFTCEVDSVVADDPAVNQWYGRSVSIATTRAAIGAPRDAQVATDAGAVYILERTGLRATDPTTGWVQFAKLMADDGAAGDKLGFAVTISEDGHTVVAGAYRRAEAGIYRSGAVYVFVRDGDGTWYQEAKLRPSNPSESAEFGTSVAIDGDYIVVGAPGGGVADGDGNRPGTAYLFERTGATWADTIERILTPSTIRGMARFGFRVSISGNALVVGAPNNDSVQISVGGVPWFRDVGSAHVFRRAGDAWPEEQVIGDACLFENQDQTRDDCNNVAFGASVSIDGNAMLIGAAGGRGLGGEPTGAAHVFRWIGGAWVEEQKLFADNGAAWDTFGYSVALRGDFAFVGARDKGFGGSAYMFNRLSGSWTQEAEVTPEGGRSGDRFGVSVALGEEYAVVGAYRHPHGGIPDDAGSAYLYGYGSGRDCDASGSHDDCQILGSPTGWPPPNPQWHLDQNTNGTIDWCECASDTTCTADPPCAVGSCNVETQICEYTPQPGYCLIGTLCYADTDADPMNPCQLCDSATANDAWSPRPAGEPCGDATFSECDLADSCDGTGSCSPNRVPDGTLCTSDGVFCNDQEACRQGQCVSGDDPCAARGMICDELNDECDCNDDGDCDDGAFCNGAETCVDVGTLDAVCVDGVAPCIDAVACSEDGDYCVACFVDEDCDDGLFCTGVETCHYTYCSSSRDACAHGLVCDEENDECDCDDNWDCDDGNDCTDNVCVDGDCTFPLVDEGAACGSQIDNGCDFPDTCDGQGNCLSNELPDWAACVADEDALADDVCWHGYCYQRNATSPPHPVWKRGPWKSIQVNIAPDGRDILGDAANEPSIAIDPTDPSRIAIGWRQFDTIESGFRQAGWAYSDDGGQNWTFPGSIQPGVFHSDPVLDSDAEGNLYFLGIRCTYAGCGDLFKSTDGGMTWNAPYPGYAGDKPWMAIDRTDSIGRGHIYIIWGFGSLVRLTNGGATLIEGARANAVGAVFSGSTLSVGPDGVLYAAGKFVGDVAFGRSTNARDATRNMNFDIIEVVHSDARNARQGEERISGFSQTWIATDHSSGPNRGNVYILFLGDLADNPVGAQYDLLFMRSVDQGETWSTPIPINDGPDTATLWFPSMSVAPNGRIDITFNDTRNAVGQESSELYYTFSNDAGVTWARNMPVSHPFNWLNGMPAGQNKLGDYYDMISDDAAVNISYAATFTGGHDIYFLRVGDCDNNGIHDATDIASGTATDFNANGIPDLCDPDCNSNGLPDDLDIENGTSFDMDGNGVPDECPNALRVDADAPGRVRDGKSWLTAYRDLHYAMAAVAMDGGAAGEIWVAEGVYRPDDGTGRRDMSYAVPAGLAIYGGFSGNETERGQRDPATYETVLSGDIGIEGDASDNSYHVLLMTADAYSEPSLLDGFTILDGNADGGVGGGLWIQRGEFNVRNCRFARNIASSGGAVYAWRTTSHFARCRFFGNTASHGAGVFASRGTLIVDSCLFIGNSGQFLGTAVASGRADVRIANSTFWANTGIDAPSVGAQDGTLEIANCVLWGNSSGGSTDEDAQIGNEGVLSVDYTTIQGWTGVFGGVGNNGLDPMFVNADGPDGVPGTQDDNLRLLPGSPCINTGDPGFAFEPGAVDLAGAPRVRGCRVDRGAYESPEPQWFGDFDNSDTFDLRDFAAFQVCFDNAPSQPGWLDACLCTFDLDDDSSVDLPDLAAFEWIMTGP